MHLSVIQDFTAYEKNACESPCGFPLASVLMAYEEIDLRLRVIKKSRLMGIWKNY